MHPVALGSDDDHHQEQLNRRDEDTPSGKQATTTFTAALDVQLEHPFEPNAYTKRMAEAWGVSSDSVAIAGVSYIVAVGYLFSPAITLEQAEEAVAIATGLPAKAVSASLLPPETPVKVERGDDAAIVVSVQVQDAAAIRPLTTVLGSGAAVRTSLLSDGSRASAPKLPVVLTEPMAIARVETDIQGQGGSEPDEAAIDMLSERLGTNVIIDGVTRAQ